MTFSPESPIATDFLELTGNTPLVDLGNLLPASSLRIVAKLEQFNPGGSAKDRTAKALIEQAVQNGLIPDSPDVHLVESSSGNLGVALARQAACRGWTFTCVVDPRANRTTLATMRTLGATIDIVAEPDAETGDWLVARRKRVAELVAADPRTINLDQYSSRAAFDAHDHGTMSEIVAQLGGAPAAVLVAMSTTGTIGGCLQHVRRIGASTQVIGVDAAGSVLFGGTRGPRMLPGYGAGAVPDLSSDVTPDRIIRVPDEQAVIGARALTRAESILPGASGGAVIAALGQIADQLEQELGTGATVVVILHDSGPAYLETVYDDAWVEDNLKMDPAECERRVQQWAH